MSKFKITKASSSLCNELIILKSLHPMKDADTTKTIVDHIKGSINKERIGKSFIEVTPKVKNVENISQLRDELKKIELSCEKGIFPLIHFETHGDETLGLEFIDRNDNKECIGWPELLSLLRAINIACQGHLTVILAACYSFSLEKTISLQEKSPFFALVGYEQAAKPEEIERDLKIIYDSLFIGSKLPDKDKLPENCKVYTEYDLVSPLIALLVGYRKHPELIAASPFSKKDIVINLALTSLKESIPEASVTELRTLTKKIFKSDNFIRAVISQFIHNAINLELLLKDIYEYCRTPVVKPPTAD